MRGHFTLASQTLSGSLSEKNKSAPYFKAIDYYADNRYIRFAR
jgi:hypothetical protein